MIASLILAKIPKSLKGVSPIGMKKDSWPINERIVFHNREPYVLSDSTDSLPRYEYKDEDKGKNGKKLCEDWFLVNVTQKEIDKVERILASNNSKVGS